MPINLFVAGMKLEHAGLVFLKPSGKCTPSFHSSAGQSVKLLTSRSQVRALLGAKGWRGVGVNKHEGSTCQHIKSSKQLKLVSHGVPPSTSLHSHALAANFFLAGREQRDFHCLPIVTFT